MILNLLCRPEQCETVSNGAARDGSPVILGAVKDLLAQPETPMKDILQMLR